MKYKIKPSITEEMMRDCGWDAWDGVWQKVVNEDYYKCSLIIFVDGLETICEPREVGWRCGYYEEVSPRGDFTPFIQDLIEKGYVDIENEIKKEKT